MAYTGVFGHPDSMPGNIVLAGDAPAEGGGGLFEREVEDELVLVQDVHCSLHTEFVSSELALEHVAEGELPEEVSSVLDLQQALNSNIKSESLSSVLSLQHTAVASLLEQEVSSVLSLSQSVTSNILEHSLSSVLSLVSEAETAPGSEQSVSVGSILSLSSEASMTYGVANISIESTLAFVGEEFSFLQQFVNLTIYAEVSSFISLVQEVAPIYPAANILLLDHTVEWYQSVEVENTLAIEHEVSIAGSTWVRLLESDLDLNHALTYEIENTSVLCNYSPFVGTNGDGNATTPPPTEITPALSTGTLTLTWPYMTPTSTLVLRNPDFGNQHSIDHQRINRQTRGGTLIIFRDPQWPKIETLKLAVTALSQQQIDDYEDFLGDSLGDEIGLTDWFGRTWRGIISTPDSEITDQGECDKVISFEFQGVKV